MRTRTRDIDPGTPSGVKKWAEARLDALRQLRADLNLPKLSKHWIFSGYTVNMWDSEFGDFLRIKGGVIPWIGIAILDTSFGTFRRLDYEEIGTPILPLAGSSVRYWREPTVVTAEKYHGAYATKSGESSVTSVPVVWPNGTEAKFRDDIVSQIAVTHDNGGLYTNNADVFLRILDPAAAGTAWLINNSGKVSYGQLGWIDDAFWIVKDTVDTGFRVDFYPNTEYNFYVHADADGEKAFLTPPQTPSNESGFQGNVVFPDGSHQQVLVSFSNIFPQTFNRGYILKVYYDADSGPPVVSDSTIYVVRAKGAEVKQSVHAAFSVVAGEPSIASMQDLGSSKRVFARNSWGMRIQLGAEDGAQNHGWMTIQEAAGTWSIVVVLDVTHTSNVLNVLDLSPVPNPGGVAEEFMSLEYRQALPSGTYQMNTTNPDQDDITLFTGATVGDMGSGGYLVPTRTAIHAWVFRYETPPSGPQYPQLYDARTGALINEWPSAGIGSFMRPGPFSTKLHSFAFAHRSSDNHKILYRSDGQSYDLSAHQFDLLSYSTTGGGSPVDWIWADHWKNTAMADHAPQIFQTTDDALYLYMCGRVDPPDPTEADPTPQPRNYVCEFRWADTDIAPTIKKLWEEAESGVITTPAVSTAQGARNENINTRYFDLCTRFNRWGV